MSSPATLAFVMASLTLEVCTAHSRAGGILSAEEALQRASKGDGHAAAIYATYLSIGWKLPKNPFAAANFARTSVNMGSPLGLFRLGALTRAGEGVEKNEQLGLNLQRQSFDGLNKMVGDPYAITALGIMFFQGKVVRQDQTEAARLYKLAADMGYAPAQHNYAMCAFAGHGMPKNELEFRRYLQQALDQDYPPSIDFARSPEQFDSAGPSLPSPTPPGGALTMPSTPLALNPTPTPVHLTQQALALRERVTASLFPSIQALASSALAELRSGAEGAKAFDLLGPKDKAYQMWVVGYISAELAEATESKDLEAGVAPSRDYMKSLLRIYDVLELARSKRPTDAATLLREIVSVGSVPQGVDEKLRDQASAAFLHMLADLSAQIAQSDEIRDQVARLTDEGQFKAAQDALKRAMEIDARTGDSEALKSMRSREKKEALDQLGL